MPRHIVIVLVEDEVFVRTATAEALRDEDFEVMEAEHAEDALRLLQAHASAIHVLFTDIHMPGTMDGLALAHHTALNWPWIALLISSGRARPDSANLPVKSRFLAKPYNNSCVADQIREMTET